MLEGTNQRWKSGKWMLLFIPMMFFIRRLIFVLSAIFWKEFFWGQVALQYAICTAMIIFLQWSEPLDTKFDNRLETFNECVTVVILYLMMSFTEFVPLVEDRDMIGDYYIAVILFFVSVHMLLLLVGMAMSIKQWIKRKLTISDNKLKKKQMQKQKVDVNSKQDNGDGNIVVAKTSQTKGSVQNAQVSSA